MKKLMIIIILLFSFNFILNNALVSDLYGYRNIHNKGFDCYLKIYLRDLTVKEYVFENNKDYLIIGGKKKEVELNSLKKTDSKILSMFIDESSLKGLNLLKSLGLKRFELLLLVDSASYRDKPYVYLWSFKPIYDFFSLFYLNEAKFKKYNLEYGFKIKNSELLLNDYLYNIFECTGDNNFIYVDDMQYTIHFDRDNSNMDALNSLYGIKWQVSYTITDKIRVIGHYNKISRKFILKHWYLDKPFGEIIRKDEEYLKTIKRSKLKISDFTEKLKLNPKVYHSSKYFYKNNKIIKMSELKTDSLLSTYVKSLLSIFRVD